MAFVAFRELIPRFNLRQSDRRTLLWGYLSPKFKSNKTFEGFLGGLITTIALGYGLAFLLSIGKEYAALFAAVLAFTGFMRD